MSLTCNRPWRTNSLTFLVTDPGGTSVLMFLVTDPGGKSSLTFLVTDPGDESTNIPCNRATMEGRIHLNNSLVAEGVTVLQVGIDTKYSIC